MLPSLATLIPSTFISTSPLRKVPMEGDVGCTRGGGGEVNAHGLIPTVLPFETQEVTYLTSKNPTAHRMDTFRNTYVQASHVEHQIAAVDASDDRATPGAETPSNPVG